MLGNVFIVFLLSISATLAFHQFRALNCSVENPNPASESDKTECNLILKNEEFDKGRDTPRGAGCFKEGAGNDTKVFCAVVCPNAHAVYHSKSLNDKLCFKFYTYGLVERDGDWYLWRSGKCRFSLTVFEIGCKFENPFESQFPDDNAILRFLNKARKA